MCEGESGPHYKFYNSGKITGTLNGLEIFVTLIILNVSQPFIYNLILKVFQYIIKQL